jgi:UDP-glucose 4-epimerase
VHGLLTVMVRAGVRRILFSSRAAVYGVHSDGLVTEESQTARSSLYVWCKLMSENMSRDTAAVNSSQVREAITMAAIGTDVHTLVAVDAAGRKLGENLVGLLVLGTHEAVM